jgi:hypothetical protein
MNVKISEKWLFEPLPHLRTVSFLRGSALFSTKQEAEDYLEGMARGMARVCDKASEKEKQYKLAKGGYHIRPVTVMELR